MSAERRAVVIQSRYSLSKFQTACGCAGSSVLKSRLRVISGQLHRSCEFNASSTIVRTRSKKYSFRVGSKPSGAALCDRTDHERPDTASVYLERSCPMASGTPVE